MNGRNSYTNDKLNSVLCKTRNNDETLCTSIDKFAKDRRILAHVFKGEYTATNSVPTVSPEYLETCKKNITIGLGGSGVVYLAEDYVANMVFAVKEYYDISSAERELNILSQFRHPYIVRLLAQSVRTSKDNSEEIHSLVFEYMPKGSIETILQDEEQRSKLSFVQRLTIISNVTAALCYLHNVENKKDKKVYHRDLKSSNICLDDDLTAKIIDCDISKVTPGTAVRAINSKELSFRSLLQYMAPEYLRKPKYYNEECEVFSLGVIMVELLTGEIASEESCHYENFIIREKALYKFFLDDAILEEMENNNNLKIVVSQFCELAIKCMSQRAEDRPKLKETQKQVNNLLRSLQLDLQLLKIQTKGDKSRGKQKCMICTIVLGHILCCNGHRSHVLCERHFIEHILSHLDSKSIPCIGHDICGNHITTEQIAKVSIKLLERHVEAKTRASDSAKESSTILEALNKISSDVTDVKIIATATQEKLDDLSTRLLKGMLSLASDRVSCPTLFWVVPQNNKPANRSKASTTIIKKWWQNASHNTWLLYLVCAHERGPVHPPIEILSPKEWLKKVAPCLKLMLVMVQLTLKATTGVSFDLSVIPASLTENGGPLEGLIEYTNSLLGAEAKQIIETETGIWKSGEKVDDLIAKIDNQLQHFGPTMQLAFEAIAQKAKEQPEWRSKMTQVSSKEGLVWVKNEYASMYEPVNAYMD